MEFEAIDKAVEMVKTEDRSSAPLFSLGLGNSGKWDRWLPKIGTEGGSADGLAGLSMYMSKLVYVRSPGMWGSKKECGEITASSSRLGGLLVQIVTVVWHMVAIVSGASFLGMRCTSLKISK